VSSRGHFFGGVLFDDPHFQRQEYDKWKAYGQSKTANILFALGLDLRGESHGVRAFSLHPGRIVDTGLARYLTIEELCAAGVLDEHGQVPANAKHKTIAQGAATNVWCAVNAQLQGMGGVYCENADISLAIAADSPADAGFKPWAIDPEFAERLWSLSEELTGVPFRF
jgi:NAD(P)-dependent dehydrogenase (short-subunit alcohol dehydrogenase family)